MWPVLGMLADAGFNVKKWSVAEWSCANVLCCVIWLWLFGLLQMLSGVCFGQLWCWEAQVMDVIDGLWLIVSFVTPMDNGHYVVIKVSVLLCSVFLDVYVWPKLCSSVRQPSRAPTG